MAYCVNCGVELAPSQRACPLCAVEAVNPAQPWREPESHPYPQQLEQVARHVNRRYGAYLATIGLLIPLAVAMLLDLLEGGVLNWSPYVLGAGMCVFVTVLLPFYVAQRRPYFFLVMDVVALALYMALIGWRSGNMEWVWTLAQPLCLVVGGSVMLATYLARRKGKKVLNLLSDIALIVGGSVVLIEVLTDTFIWHRIRLTWSLYTLIPMIAVAGTFRLIERKEKLKSNILKRLFV